MRETEQVREAELQASWEHNADVWTAAVRGGQIASRRAGTDAAIVRACERVGLGRVLDVGCGEGWLARVLAERGADVVGIDGSTALIARARAAGGGPRYEVASYESLAAAPELAVGPWTLVVCNFSLLGERLTPVLAALAARLDVAGTLLIQTVHPWSTAAAAASYADGWRTEAFAGFADRDFVPMPWYFHTLESWATHIRDAGLALTSLEEPRSPAQLLPLSLLLECRTV